MAVLAVFATSLLDFEIVRSCSLLHTLDPPPTPPTSPVDGKHCFPIVRPHQVPYSLIMRHRPRLILLLLLPLVLVPSRLHSLASGF